MTQGKVLEIIDYDFTTKYRSPAKLKAVAKASSKFINKYKGKHTVYVGEVIDGCLQFYSSTKDLDMYLEDNKVLFLR
tara:strand:- start:301 stop:531 length:231 start_codon:yes stop_codon:yes gene_type:complete